MRGIRHTQVSTVTGTSQKFTNGMIPGQQYVFTANVDCWVKVAVTGGAAAVTTADNILYLAGQRLPLKSPDNGTTTTNGFVHMIKDTGQPDGRASLGIDEE